MTTLFLPAMARLYGGAPTVSLPSRAPPLPGAPAGSVKRFDQLLLFGAGIPLLVAILAVADARGCFRRDLFGTPLRKAAALTLLFLVLVATVLLPATESGIPIDTSRLSFGGVFLVQALLAGFLAGWWLLSGRPPLREFLALTSRRPLVEAGAGVCLGLIGWVLTLLVGLLAITVVLAVAFRSTGSVWAPLFAHGTFNAVQLFIFLPEATKLLPLR